MNLSDGNLIYLATAEALFSDLQLNKGHVAALIFRSTSKRATQARMWTLDEKFLNFQERFILSLIFFDEKTSSYILHFDLIKI